MIAYGRMDGWIGWRANLLRARVRTHARSRRTHAPINPSRDNYSRRRRRRRRRLPRSQLSSFPRRTSSSSSSVASRRASCFRSLSRSASGTPRASETLKFLVLDSAHRAHVRARVTQPSGEPKPFKTTIFPASESVLAELGPSSTRRLCGGHYFALLRRTRDFLTILLFTRLNLAAEIASSLFHSSVRSVFPTFMAARRKRGG